MNNKEQVLNQIIDIVVSCCSIDVNGLPSLTKEDLLGKSRAENCVMARCILTHMLLSAGYSVTTIAILLNRTPKAVRDMMNKGHIYIQTSRAFRIANAEATLKCKDIDNT